MNPLCLPIFVHSEETERLADMGQEFNYKDCDVFEYYFYNIDCVAPITKDLTKVVSGGVEYNTPMPIQKVIDQIREWKISNGGYN